MSDAMSEVDFAGIGERIEKRRLHLGLNHQKIYSLGGPSPVTMRGMERGDPTRRRLDTTFPLEQILGWAPNAIDDYLDHGTEPRIVREPDYSEGRIESAADLDAVPTEILEQALRERKAST